MSKETSSFSSKDYHDPPPAPLIDVGELGKWSFYRALIAEFVATLLFLYITVLTVIGYKSETDPSKNHDTCGGVGILGIAWAFGGMIFILVYCTAGISGGHINPAVTFGLFLARKVSLVRAILYMIAQCLGAICGVALVKTFQKAYYLKYGGGANQLAAGYSTGTGLAAEIIGTFVLVYTVFSATDPKRSARDSHIPVCLLQQADAGAWVFSYHFCPSLTMLEILEDQGLKKDENGLNGLNGLMVARDNGLGGLGSGACSLGLDKGPRGLGGEKECSTSNTCSPRNKG